MIKPCITFQDSAEEAVKFYVSLFPKGKVLGADFILDGREYLAFDGGPSFNFTEGISLMVMCKTQEEVDRYWSKLTQNGGEEGPCGWLKDRYGLSWQIIPEQLTQMLSDPKSGNSDAAMQAMLKMKKLDISELEKAYRGARV